MEWQISPSSRKSSLNEAPFGKGDRIVSHLVKPAEGDLIRVDILESEEEQMELAGESLCRWTHVFKPKAKDNREELEAMKLTADNLFISLFEGEEEPTAENGKFKQFLGLMLERRRVLRVKERDDNFTYYIHRPTKREFAVPNVELDPLFFIENQEKLDFILTGPLASEGDSAPAKARSTESEEGT